ncbi:MAG: hypothetical protein LBR05_10955 [Azoarcus sp.]|jgi:hypothetical protein|nr:hypothetical protein [Azoarcus sp.]
MRVHLTYDVEIWCDGWKRLQEKFPPAFQRYVYGPQNGALPLNLAILRDCGLKAVFFVEPLFSFCFGLAPLQEIVGLIREAGQEVQLHLHPEWLDEMPTPLLPARAKTRRLHDLAPEEQTLLLRHASERLVEAGAARPNAFRAGNFAIGDGTLAALAANGFEVDSSVNASYPFDYPVESDARRWYCSRLGGIAEFPVTQFRDGFGKRRHMQITACSSREMIQALQRYDELGLRDATLVSHNFELLTPDRGKIDAIARRRFETLCAWLGKNAARFPCAPFDAAAAPVTPPTWEPVAVSMAATAVRYAEQLARRLS